MKIKKSLARQEKDELRKFKTENRKKEHFELTLSMQKVAKIVSQYFVREGWTDSNADYGMAWRLFEDENEELNMLISMAKNPDEKGLGTEETHTVFPKGKDD